MGHQNPRFNFFKRPRYFSKQFQLCLQVLNCIADLLSLITTNALHDDFFPEMVHMQKQGIFNQYLSENPLQQVNCTSSLRQMQDFYIERLPNHIFIIASAHWCKMDQHSTIREQHVIRCTSASAQLWNQGSILHVWNLEVTNRPKLQNTHQKHIYYNMPTAYAYCTKQQPLRVEMRTPWYIMIEIVIKPRLLYTMNFPLASAHNSHDLPINLRKLPI